MPDKPCKDSNVHVHARIDGYHIATRRADRKDQITISVNLFEGTVEKHRYAGVIMFMRKNLPDDYVRQGKEGRVIYMHALLSDFDPLMEMVRGELPVAIEFWGKSEDKGGAFLKSLALEFPGRKKDLPPSPPTEIDCE
jgi:hypothetical protein